MARLLSALLLVGSLGPLGISLPFPLSLPSLHLPAAVERWLWNPRERMNRAIADFRKGDKDSRKEARQAIAEADAALRLAPNDPMAPIVQYDAGTVHLGAGDPKGAAKLLTQAAKSPGLTSVASYNLGNAHLADDDYDGAIAAYQQALRADPANQDAKWNLELALRKRQDKQQMKGPAGGKGAQGGGGAPSQRPGQDQKSQQQNGSPNPDPGKSREQTGGDQGKSGNQGQPQPRPGDQPLPQWKNQPDMSAAEAAALLESVENLERQQRRAQAAQRAERRTVKGKDW